MNLYLIKQDVNDDYDTFDSAVVMAESEDEARRIHPGGEEEWGRPYCRVWAPTPEQVQVELIGRLDDGYLNKTRSKVICSSFNAG